MKEIHSNYITSLEVLSNPFEDRLSQYIILFVINYIHNNYGFLIINSRDLICIINNYFLVEKKEISLSEDNLMTYINGLRRYDLEWIIENEMLHTLNFILIKDETELDLNHELLLNIVNERFCLYDPVLLKNELKKYKQKLMNYDDLKIDFLSTSKLFEKREISEKLSEIINNAEDHVYLMLAFYQENVLFFSDFLINKIKESKIVFKIIYNPNDIKNEEFVKRLMKGLGNRTDFFKAYSKRYLKSPVSKFIGNLHSKAVITDSELLVGSANLTGMSLYNNVENAIYTNHIASVKSANHFFESLWKELREPNAI